MSMASSKMVTSSKMQGGGNGLPGGSWKQAIKRAGREEGTGVVPGGRCIKKKRSQVGERRALVEGVGERAVGRDQVGVAPRVEGLGFRVEGLGFRV